MQRNLLLRQIKDTPKWDVIVIGGGASGLGVALDAVSRGFKTLLIEKEDFGSGTSSKSTKLVHGGVRYLAQGYISLVMEALKERAYILKNAGHLSGTQKFAIPAFTIIDAIKYYIGLRLYDLLSFRKSLGKTKLLSKEDMKRLFPSIDSKKLICGIEYTDGYFDDSRLCIDLVKTIHKNNGLCLNYFSFDHFLFDKDDKITGVKCQNNLNGDQYTISGTVVVNATGVHGGETMQKADQNSPLRITPSKGSHIVISQKLTAEGYALMIPKTTDGRVLFAIPYMGRTLIGTTDIAQNTIEENPIPTTEEIGFILNNVNLVLDANIKTDDISATFAGLRPLASPKEGKTKTKEISRSHKVIISKSNLVSLIGGKWTTFRKMGEDTLDKILNDEMLPEAKSTSLSIMIVNKSFRVNENEKIHPSLPYSLSQMKYMIEHELVETLDDLLSRRTRCTFIDLAATHQISLLVLELMAELKCWDNVRKVKEIESFNTKNNLKFNS
jgi:glycerol-3-phosphate dehydrogenase